MKHILFIALLLLSINGTSQNNFNSEGMTVTKSDLDLNLYERDSSANALVIYEKGNSYVDKNRFTLKTEVSKKIKILNSKGFDNAVINIYLYHKDKKREKIHNISATTFNLENNTVTKTLLESDDIFEKKINDSFTNVTFTFPNVKEGSVITLSYVLESPFMFKYKEWYFQEDIPKLYSEYRASIPGNYEYNIKLVGYLKLDSHDVKIESNCLEFGSKGWADCANYVYAMTNIPAFIEEDYMTTKLNYLARVEYELKTFKGMNGNIEHYTKTWKTVDSEIKSDKNIGKQLNRNNIAKDLLSEKILTEKDALKKAKDIYTYVQDTYTWNEKFNIYDDISVKDLIDNKSGNVSEINILLHNLLEEQGFETNAVLLSTRNNGFVTKIHPVLSDFNYLIVQIVIEGKTYLLDATDKYNSFGELPFRCLNQEGRLLDFKNGSSWIDISPEKTYSIMYRNDLTLNESGILEGSVERRSNGYKAAPLKKLYFENKDAYINTLNEKHQSIEISDYSSTIQNKSDFEFVESFDVSQEIEMIGDNLYLNPFVFSFFTENFFKLQERTYPIDFGYKDSFMYVLKLTIDNSYEVLEEPKALTLRLPDNKGSIIFTSTIENNVMTIFFKLSFNDALYPPEYYSAMKEFMNNAVDIQKNSLLVLKKK